MRKGKPNDPERRARILRATLEIIGSEGVHAASYRRIAAQAGVPLGSATYYFPTSRAHRQLRSRHCGMSLEPRYAAPLRASPGTAPKQLRRSFGHRRRDEPDLDDIRLYKEMRHYGARSSQVADLLRAFQEESLAMLRAPSPTAPPEPSTR